MIGSLNFSAQRFNAAVTANTHSTNYKKASKALYHDDRLVKNPDLLADDEDAA